MKDRFYRCSHCGNMVGLINDAGVPLMCCGTKMEALVPNTVEASGEKHLPYVHVEDGSVFVSVGTVEHPMADEHHIEWIYLETEDGGHRKALRPGEKPEVTFALGDDKPVAVYAYCNLHGLWKTDIK